MFLGHTRWDRRQNRGRRRVAELDDAEAIALLVCIADDSMSPCADDAVGKAFEHQTRVDDHVTRWRFDINPSPINTDLQALCGRPWKCGYQIDVVVSARPHMLAAGGMGHRRVSDRPGQRRAVGDHLIEERFATSEPDGDHP